MAEAAAVQVFDLETYLPGPSPSPYGEEIGPPGPDRLPPPPGYGFANYGTIFAARGNRGSGQQEPGDQHQAGDQQDGQVPSVAERAAQLVALMDQAGVSEGAISTGSNAVTAEVIRLYPDRFRGIAHLSPYDGMRAVRELERLVREEGFSGLSVASLYDQVRAGDARYYPLYAKAVELDVPVRVYTAMTYANDRPYDLGHPRELDQIAMDFPELRLIAGLAGWPWINEMVGLLRRHPNLYCDTAAHRPRHLATPGSGWEQFLQFGNTLLQDKIMVGLSWALLGMSMTDLIAEYQALPLKETVQRKWLYSNAKRFFDRE